MRQALREGKERRALRVKLVWKDPKERLAQWDLRALLASLVLKDFVASLVQLGNKDFLVLLDPTGPLDQWVLLDCLD